MYYLFISVSLAISHPLFAWVPVVFQVERNGEKSQQRLCHEKCELAWEEMKSQGCVDQFAILVDDEELELRELQAGKHIMASCDHFMTNGVNSCSLCKGEGRT